MSIARTVEPKSYRAAILAVCWICPGKSQTMLRSSGVLASLIPKPATLREMQTIDRPSLMNTDGLGSYRLDPATLRATCPRTARSSHVGLLKAEEW